MDVATALAALAACLIGGVVGATELLSRYRDEPIRVLWTRPALFYVAVNALSSAGALLAIRTFGWTFGVTSQAVGEAVVRVWEVLVAGFGAMALFRSSLFTVRVGDQDVAVGPHRVLQIILGVLDRAIDRRRGEERSGAVVRIMEEVSFAKAQTALPTYCLKLLQNVPSEEQEELGNKVSDIEELDLDDRIKALMLGLAVMNVAGEEVLKAGVEALRPQIAAAPECRDGAEDPSPSERAAGEQV